MLRPGDSSLGLTVFGIGPLQVPELPSPRSPGPWVEMGGLAVDTRGRGGLSSGRAPSLVSQALLNGHLDQLILAQAAVQTVFLMPNGTLSAPSADLRGHPLLPLTLATRREVPPREEEAANQKAQLGDQNHPGH